MLRGTFALEEEEVTGRWEEGKSMQLVSQLVVVI